jgi:ribosomal protein S18 acetylase RimI-like enzyme
MPNEANFSITTHDQPPADAVSVVDAGLGAANQQAAPVHEVRPLACFARRPDGTVIGGAVGRTWGQCCELQQLWVAPQERHRGLGSQLVRAFERHAQQRGCRTFYLDTFSFPAPELYRSLGYRVALETHGFAPGMVKYTMMRRIGERAPSEVAAESLRYRSPGGEADA